MFNKIFAALYCFFNKNSTNHTPRVSAQLCVMTIQLWIILLPVIILQNCFDLLIIRPEKRFSNLYFLPLAIVWEIALEVYYNKNRAGILLDTFNDKPDVYKNFWLKFSWCMLFIPIAILAIIGFTNR